MKFPTATANFSTSFHTATTVAEWHKIATGEWGDEGAEGAGGAGGAGGERITNNLFLIPY
ncbi:hypothetical protein LC607_26935 [Nostoc sp. CHAB 5824]|nr:hypothetical protein [Nostoc sp. CHAB 5824]